MIESIDQTGRKILLKYYPQRIISLVPSQTELMADIGLHDEVVGITKFCVHPENWFTSKTRIGGTKQVNMETIQKLQPDLIIANKEENVREQIEELEKRYTVWISDVNDLEDAYYMINQIGRITGKEKKADDLVSAIKKEFLSLLQKENPIPCCYLIWQNPYMTVGGDTFINAMLEKAGFNNLYKNYKRYPETTTKEIRNLNPEVLLLSSEPFPFKQKHIEELQIHLPQTKIFLVDGEMFSWYGSRLLKAPAYFRKLNDQIVRT